MLQNFSQLFEEIEQDVVITAHLLHHRSAPTVAQILAGVAHFRYRGRSDVVHRLFAQAQVWSRGLNLAAPEPLALALALVPALGTPPRLLAQPLPGLASRSQLKLAEALVSKPVGSLQQLAVQSRLSLKTVRNAVWLLRSANIIELELVQNRLYFVSSEYARLVHRFAVSAGSPVAKAAGQVARTNFAASPFSGIFDPMGFRWDQPPSDRAARYARVRRL